MVKFVLPRTGFAMIDVYHFPDSCFTSVIVTAVDWTGNRLLVYDSKTEHLSSAIVCA